MHFCILRHGTKRRRFAPGPQTGRVPMPIMHRLRSGGDDDGEGGPLAGDAVEGDLPAVRLDDGLDKGKAETVAGKIPAGAMICSRGSFWCCGWLRDRRRPFF